MCVGRGQAAREPERVQQTCKACSSIVMDIYKTVEIEKKTKGGTRRPGQETDQDQKKQKQKKRKKEDADFNRSIVRYIDARGWVVTTQVFRRVVLASQSKPVERKVGSD